jgi:hypothetical protein
MPKRHNQKRISPCHMTVKIQNKERILKAAKEKHKLTDKPIRII